MSGSLLFSGRGDDVPYTTGVVTDRQTQAQLHASKIKLEVELHEGTRRFKRCGVRVSLEDGRELSLAVQARGASIAMQGLGYSGGYNDGQGLGAWRADQHLEHDIWDVSHPSKSCSPMARTRNTGTASSRSACRPSWAVKSARARAA